MTYDTTDTSNEENDEVYQASSEYLETLNPGNLKKKGCIVMLLRNINPRNGLCNGTRLIIKDTGKYVLTVAVIKDNNEENEQVELIPRITLNTLEGDFPLILSRKQFPVRLSFAMTTNKSQGQFSY